MKKVLMSLVPGAIIASLVDFLYPHLTSVGFVYSFIAGMILYIVLSHILSSLIERRTFDQEEAEPYTILRTKLY